MTHPSLLLRLSKVVQSMPLGITDALWSGIGIVAIVLVGMALITAGVVIVNLTGELHN